MDDKQFFTNPHIQTLTKVMDPPLSLLKHLLDSRKGDSWQQWVGRFLFILGAYLLVVAAVSTDQQIVNPETVLMETSITLLRWLITIMALIAIAAPWWMQCLEKSR